MEIKHHLLVYTYIKLNKTQTRTNLGQKSQWKKWHQIQIFVGRFSEINQQSKIKVPLIK